MQIIMCYPGYKSMTYIILHPVFVYFVFLRLEYFTVIFLTLSIFIIINIFNIFYCKILKNNINIYRLWIFYALLVCCYLNVEFLIFNFCKRPISIVVQSSSSGLPLPGQDGAQALNLSSSGLKLPRQLLGPTKPGHPSGKKSPCSSLGLLTSR